MTSIVEDYLESPGIDNETDDVFPCKGCGEVWCFVQLRGCWELAC